MGDQFGFVPDGILPGLAGARALGERGSEASFTVPLLRPPDRFPLNAEGAGDLALPLSAVEKQERAGAVKCAHALLPLRARV